jgi:hypothetical protein
MEGVLRRAWIVEEGTADYQDRASGGAALPSAHEHLLGPGQRP